MKAYRAIFSSDWNQCLAPCGPFDCIAFGHPELAPELEAVFKAYTGNRTTLGRAVDRIHNLLPEPLSPRQMDVYLQETFSVYTGVAELIQWCARNRVLFMLNTTGAIGYFQRVWALEMLPPVPALSAHPMIRYPRGKRDPRRVYTLLETTDKGRHTAAAAKEAGIAGKRVIVMGDSAGDGPHFAWAASVGALRVASMIKPSLVTYCREESIVIDRHFGVSYEPGDKRQPQQEMAVDFLDLIPVVEGVLAR